LIPIEKDENWLPLVLGTAQLGMDYGIANRLGKPDLKEAEAIVHAAWERGVHFFDTAQAYGESEKVLGTCFEELGIRQHEDLRVSSKLDPGIQPSDDHAVEAGVDQSLRILGVERLWSLMLHREGFLAEQDRLVDIGRKLKNQGKVERFGISVYSPENAFRALAMDQIDIVQVPFNVFDQRALQEDLFGYASERGKHLLVRSLYLQGLLLLDADQIPPWMGFSREALHRFHSFARDVGIAPKLLSMAFVSQKAKDALIIFGSESAEQVKENVSLYRRSITLDLPDMGFLAQKDPRLINPSHWKNYEQ
jgi:aryl-alcohol dehydrogenase-like predicted oxidoreductase